MNAPVPIQTAALRVAKTLARNCCGGSCDHLSLSAMIRVYDAIEGGHHDLAAGLLRLIEDREKLMVQHTLVTSRFERLEQALRAREDAVEAELRTLIGGEA